MITDQAFLDAIRATPGDDTNRLVYADWLEDHSDPARPVHSSRTGIGTHGPGRSGLRCLEAEMQSCRQAIDPRWVNEVSRAYDLVLVGYDVGKKIPVIHVLRELTSAYLAECKATSENLPATIWQGVSRAKAEFGRERFADVTKQVEIRLSETVARLPSLVLFPEPGHALLLVALEWVWAVHERVTEAIQQTKRCTRSEAEAIVQGQRPMTIQVFPTEEQAQRAAQAFAGIAAVGVWPADRFGTPEAADS